MSLLVASLLGALLTCQESSTRIVVGEPSKNSWPLSGTAPVEAGTELHLRARRVERQWDTNRRLFVESLSDRETLRALVEVTSQGFSGSLKPGPPGRYGLSVATEDKQLFSETATLGLIEPLFKSSPEAVKVILEIREKIRDLLDDLEKILKRQTEVSESVRDDFLKRTADAGRKLDELFMSTDFLGTVQALKRICFHLQNVQIWDDKKIPP